MSMNSVPPPDPFPSRSHPLRPHSRDCQRVWQIGAPPLASTDSNLVLKVSPHDHRPFSSLLTALTDIRNLQSERQNESLDVLGQRLIKLLSRHGLHESGNSARRSVSGAQLAILRRVSRESIETSELIDAIARALNHFFADHRPGCKVTIPAADHLDRASLKVFARSMLLVKSEDPIEWCWTLSQLPEETSEESLAPTEPHVLWRRTRQDFFRRLRAVLAPQVGHGTAEHVLGPPRDESALALAGEAQLAALVLQSYDACFLPTNHQSGFSSDPTHHLRLQALASVNTGYHDSAVAFVEQAFDAAQSVSLRAHLAYIRGLITAKRQCDIAQSEQWYTRGLRELDRGGPDGAGDPQLERAWILNGLALNRLLQARLSAQRLDSVLQETFELLRQAFALVSEGHTSERTYLRFNLMRNMSFFIEFQGHLDWSLRVWEETFHHMLDDESATEPAWRGTVQYRSGYLLNKMDRLDEAAACLDQALKDFSLAHRDVRRLEVQHAIGIVALRRQRFDQAIDAFSGGLQASLEYRFRNDAIRQYAGLTKALHACGRHREADEASERLAHQEPSLGIGKGQELNASRMLKLASSLPNSVPEIDLEIVPDVSVGRMLAGDGQATKAAA